MSNTQATFDSRNPKYTLSEGMEQLYDELMMSSLSYEEDIAARDQVNKDLNNAIKNIIYQHRIKIRHSDTKKHIHLLQNLHQDNQGKYDPDWLDVDSQDLFDYKRESNGVK